MQFYYRHFDQQFGPVVREELMGLARSGKLYATDLVWAEGWPTWQEAHRVPGLFEKAPPQPPRPPGMSPYATAPPQAAGDDLLMRMVLPVGRSPWAIAAGYLGLFSLLFLPAPFALLTGILAVRDIRRNPHKHGMGRAVFGIVMGGLVSLLMVAIFVLPHFLN